MGVVDDRDEHFAGAMDFKSLLDQEPFAAMVVTLELNLKGFAEDPEGIVIGMQGAIDDGGDHPFGIMLEEGVLEHGLARARLAQDQAEAALLGVDLQDVEDLLLMGEQGDRLGIEGMALDAEMGADHKTARS
jgi:hypothetical protein